MAKNNTAKALAAAAAAKKGKSKRKQSSSSFSYPVLVGSIVVLLASVALVRNDSSSQKAIPQKTFPCDDEALSQYLHDSPVAGFHVVCIREQERNDNRNGIFSADIYSGAQKQETKTTVDLSALDAETDEVSWAELQKSLKAVLSLRTTDNLHQPWAVYTPEGERVVEEDQTFGGDPRLGSKLVVQQILDCHMIFIFEGGQFVWPGVREGYKRTIDLYSVIPGAPLPPHLLMDKKRTNATIETISLQPLIFSVEGFLSSDECDFIQKTAEPELQYSPVVKNDMMAREGKVSSDYRTSQLARLSSARHKTLMDISFRTSGLVRTPNEHQEPLQVLRYGLNEKYDSHKDAMQPENYKDNPAVLRKLRHGRINRFATVFCYLSDVQEGGETIFPRWNGAPFPDDLSDCSKGFKVKPQKGKVIIFYNLLPDGQIDQFSLHGSCPVKAGIKWAANKWVWNAQPPN